MPRRAADPLLARTLRAERRGRQVGRLLDRVIRAAWQQALDAIPDSPADIRRPFAAAAVRGIITRLNATLPALYAAAMTDLARWAHATAARHISAAARRASPQLAIRRYRLLGEDEEFRDASVDDRFGGGIDPRFALDDFGFRGDPRRVGDFAAFDYSTTLVDPPSAEALARLVGPPPASLTRLNAQQASQAVMLGVAQGQTRQEIAVALQSQFNRSATTARRIARTEGLRIATASQLEVSEQLGDLITGYQVLATLDERTRPEHRQRHGTIYYREPKPGQKGFGDMPQPPMEADGRIAWNCRCTLSPVFDDDPDPTAGYLAGSPYADGRTIPSGVPR